MFFCIALALMIYWMWIVGKDCGWFDPFTIFVGYLWGLMAFAMLGILVNKCYHGVHEKECKSCIWFLDGQSLYRWDGKAYIEIESNRPTWCEWRSCIRNHDKHWWEILYQDTTDR